MAKDLDDLFEQADIVEFISQYVDLDYRGGEYWGNSPFTNEDTPSFSVNAEKRCFKDFSSGLKGNVIDFIILYAERVLKKKCSVPQAFEVLHRWLGTSNEYKKTESTVKIMKKFAIQPMASRSHFKNDKRVFLSENLIDRFEDCPIKIWEPEGISYDITKKYKIRYDRANQQVMIPIRDVDGNLISFSARTTNPYYKTLGIPKYIYTNKLGTVDFFWGLNYKKDDIKNAGSVIIVEGVKSVLKLEQWGYNNVIASLTNHLNDYQLDILIKLGVDIIFAYDKGTDVWEDNNILKLKRMRNVYYLDDEDDWINDKDSPCDVDQMTFDLLYENRKKM